MHQDSEQAIELIFRRYYRYCCQAVYKIIPDSNLVEDLTQDVFFELWRKRDGLRINTSLQAYLRRAVINKTLNHIRDQKMKFDEEDRMGDIPSPAAGAGRQMEATELEAIIEHAIDLLPERRRIIFVLSRFEEMSYQEIADELGISLKTVENQVSKALKYLREALKDFL